MKNDQSIKPAGSSSIIWTAVVLAGVLTFAGLTFGAREYGRQRTKIAPVQSNEFMSAKLVEVARINYLLGLINDGNVAQVKEELCAKVAGDLWDLHTALPSADEDTRSFFQCACRSLVRKEKARPETYLSATPGGRYWESNVWQAIGNDVFKPMGAALKPEPPGWF